MARNNSSSTPNLGFVPRDMYVAHSFDQAFQIASIANQNWAGVQMNGARNPGYVILQHISADRLFVVVRADVARTGVFPRDYSREG